MVFGSLCTQHRDGDAYRAAPAGPEVLRDGRTMDAIATYLGQDRAAVRASELSADGFLRPRAVVLRTVAGSECDSGDYPASLEKIKALWSTGTGSQPPSRRWQHWGRQGHGSA